MKKMKKVIYSTIIITLILSSLTVLATYINLRLKNNLPILYFLSKEPSLSQLTPHGTSKRGLLFVKDECLDGNNLYRLIWQDSKCSADRATTNGYYTNKNDVQINELDLQKIMEFSKDTLKAKSPEEYINVDELETESYTFLMRAINSGGIYFYEPANKQSTGDLSVPIVYQSKEKNSKSFDQSKQYCQVATNPITSITYPYENGQCQIPDDFCSIIFDRSLIHEQGTLEYCKNKLTKN